MVSTFDPLEADFFGDLVGDTHGLWEVFEFVRSHHPKLSDEQVLELGRDYITRFITSNENELSHRWRERAWQTLGTVS